MKTFYFSIVITTLISSSVGLRGPERLFDSNTPTRRFNHDYKPFTPALEKVLFKRQTANNSSTSPLSDLISILPSDCVTTCEPFYDEILACGKLTTNADITKCSCAESLLNNVQSCAACVAQSDTVSETESRQAVEDFNTFAESCASAGLVSITGTLAASAVASITSKLSASGSALDSLAVAGASINSIGSSLIPAPSTPTSTLSPTTLPITSVTSTPVVTLGLSTTSDGNSLSSISIPSLISLLTLVCLLMS